MHRLFSQDSPIFRFLTAFANLVFVNLLTVLFSLPVITVGAAVTAACRVTRQIIQGEDGHLFRAFWAAVRENWKQATVVWLIELVFAGGLLLDFGLFQSFFSQEIYPYAVALAAVLLFITVAISSYLFFLISRYENTLGTHLKNAFVLFFHYFPRTVGMTLLNAVPAALFLLSPVIFLETFVLWVGVGFALILYIDNLMMKRVFTELENGTQEKD